MHARRCFSQQKIVSQLAQLALWHVAAQALHLHLQVVQHLLHLAELVLHKIQPGLQCCLLLHHH